MPPGKGKKSPEECWNAGTLEGGTGKKERGSFMARKALTNAWY
jgi:hypothetical protein